MNRPGNYNKYFASYSGCKLFRYCSQSFLMTCVRGVNENPDNAFNILLLSNQVILWATRALSRVSNGFLPDTIDFSFSIRQAMLPIKAVASLCGLFLPKPSAMVLNNC